MRAVLEVNASFWLDARSHTLGSTGDRVPERNFACWGLSVCRRWSKAQWYERVAPNLYGGVEPLWLAGGHLHSKVEGNEKAGKFCCNAPCAWRNKSTKWRNALCKATIEGNADFRFHWFRFRLNSIQRQIFFKCCIWATWKLRCPVSYNKMN